MPRQKDLKRLVRVRMQKTGESYTTARLHLVKTEPVPDYAAVAGMSDASVEKATGRNWSQWVAVLDAQHAMDKAHRDIAKAVGALGAGSWWSQMVTVGYERIRGLRERGQQRSGDFRASKSRTFNVPLETLFKAFASARTRNRWLPRGVTLKSSTPLKRMRLAWTDGSIATLGFLSKGKSKASVAVDHEKLPDKAAATAMKQSWAEHFDRLAELLS